MNTSIFHLFILVKQIHSDWLSLCLPFCFAPFPARDWTVKGAITVTEAAWSALEKPHQIFVTELTYVFIIRKVYNITILWSLPLCFWCKLLSHLTPRGGDGAVSHFCVCFSLAVHHVLYLRRQEWKDNQTAVMVPQTGIFFPSPPPINSANQKLLWLSEKHRKNSNYISVWMLCGLYRLS